MIGLPNCREVAMLLSAERDRPPSTRRLLRVRLHLLICRACRGYDRQLQWLEGSLRRLEGPDSPIALQPPARERILTRLRDDR